MASFTVEQDHDANIRVVRVVGEIQAGELSAFTRSPQFGRLNDLSLWDYRQASWAKVPGDKLAQGFDASKHLVPASKKIALVFASSTDFGVGRMFQGKAEYEGINNEFEVFLDVDQARDWLLNDTGEAA